MSERHRIVLAVCTHRRNEPLVRLLRSVSVAAERAVRVAAVGVVVVDDNPDGRAEPVVAGFDHDFPLGLHYRHSGSQNISTARNLGLEAAIEIGDWVAMTDDDIIVPPGWIEQLVAVQTETGADCVTGPALLTFDDAAPGWLRTQPFGEVGLFTHDELALVTEASTGNSMLRSQFLVDHPDVRFEPDLGIIGGEDMVFYRRAVDRGLVSRYSRRVAVAEPFPVDRSNYRYQLYRSLWIGNTEFLTNHRSGKAGRLRLLARGGRRSLRGLARPVRQLARGRPPQLHYATALLAQGVGMMAGVAGIRLPHR